MQKVIVVGGYASQRSDYVEKNIEKYPLITAIDISECNIPDLTSYDILVIFPMSTPYKLMLKSIDAFIPGSSKRVMDKIDSSRASSEYYEILRKTVKHLLFTENKVCIIRSKHE